MAEWGGAQLGQEENINGTIRKGKYSPAPTTTTTTTAVYVTLRLPPWILKWAGLESYGRIAYSY